LGIVGSLLVGGLTKQKDIFLSKGAEDSYQYDVGERMRHFLISQNCVCDRVCESVYLHYDTPLYFIRTNFHVAWFVSCVLCCYLDDHCTIIICRIIPFATIHTSNRIIEA
jgi:hypothetical protein